MYVLSFRVKLLMAMCEKFYNVKQFALRSMPPLEVNVVCSKLTILFSGSVSDVLSL